MIISIFPNLNNKGVKELTKEVIFSLSSLGTTVYISEKYAEVFTDSNAIPEADDSIIAMCDIAIAIGGDGTTLNVAKSAAMCPKSVPVLGINAGRLGFMSGLEKNELNLLEKLVVGDYQIDTRSMLKAEVIDKDKVVFTSDCLNDAVISRGNFARLIDINIQCDNREVMNLRADGVIISTPTGSTAYSMAAGGPVVSPEAECILATPICPHSLMDRSIIFSDDKELIVEISSDLNNKSVLTVDGQEGFDLEEGYKVRVSASPIKAKLIKLKPDNFYEILNRKLIERRA
ncbi:MAG: NAD(+)/NADH kinase [Eubacterium sp.]|nr:NAD(+)/NADH kinase [Eubacterium sp.]